VDQMATTEDKTILNCLAKALSVLYALGYAKEELVLECKNFNELETYINEIQKKFKK
jgi:hypothetical protein